MRRRSYRWSWVSLLAVMVVFAATGHRPTQAEEDREESDHDRALHAVDRGEVLPLEQVRAAIRTEVDGEVVGLELEREDGVWVYEFKVIDPSGRLVEIYADAKTGRILKTEGD